VGILCFVGVSQVARPNQIHGELRLRIGIESARPGVASKCADFQVGLACSLRLLARRQSSTECGAAPSCRAAEQHEMRIAHRGEVMRSPGGRSQPLPAEYGRRRCLHLAGD